MDDHEPQNREEIPEIDPSVGILGSIISRIEDEGPDKLDTSDWPDPFPEKDDQPHIDLTRKLFGGRFKSQPRGDDDPEDELPTPDSGHEANLESAETEEPTWEIGQTDDEEDAPLSEVPESPRKSIVQSLPFEIPSFGLPLWIWIFGGIGLVLFWASVASLFKGAPAPKSSVVADASSANSGRDPSMGSGDGFATAGSQNGFSGSGGDFSSDGFSFGGGGGDSFAVQNPDEDRLMQPAELSPLMVEEGEELDTGEPETGFALGPGVISLSKVEIGSTASATPEIGSSAYGDPGLIKIAEAPREEPQIGSSSRTDSRPPPQVGSPTRKEPSRPPEVVSTPPPRIGSPTARRPSPPPAEEAAPREPRKRNPVVTLSRTFPKATESGYSSSPSNRRSLTDTVSRSLFAKAEKSSPRKSTSSRSSSSSSRKTSKKATEILVPTRLVLLVAKFSSDSPLKLIPRKKSSPPKKPPLRNVEKPPPGPSQTGRIIRSIFSAISGPLPSSASIKRGQSFELKNIGMEMIWIKPLGIWVAKTEVTHRQFELGGGVGKSRFSGPRLAKDSVTWNQAMDFCEKVTAYERRKGRLPDGYHYTLPTEAQWKVYVGDANLENAVYGRRNSEGPLEPGTKPPNNFGLYDVRGNLWEWMQDNFYRRSSYRKALRGGCYSSSAKLIMDTRGRYYGTRNNDYFLYGFRFVLAPED